MVKSMNQHQREEYLNDFIDALILECKPSAPSSMDQDFSAMLETVRSVKRLRSEKELVNDLLIQETRSADTPAGDMTNTFRQKLRKREWIKWASVAAALFLVVGVINQIQRTPSTTGIADEAPAMMRSAEMAEGPLAGIYAMADSFEQLENYQGILEIRRDFRDHSWTEKVEITYAKPNQFYTVTTQEDGTSYTQIYDGQGQLISFFGEGTSEVTVQEMSPEMLEMYLNEYHVGTLLREIQTAPEVLEAGFETLDGRDTTIYQYRYDPDSPWHRAWVDQRLQLPVKVEANFPNGDQVIREFTRLAVDVPLEPTYFAFDLTGVEDVYYAETHFGRGSADDDFLAAADAPPQEESVSMFAMEAAMPQTGTAAVVRQIDSYYLELRLIDIPAPFQEFKLSDELRESLRETALKPGSLFLIAYEGEENEIPVLTSMNAVEEVRMDARYMGRVDSNFGEFNINGRLLVIALFEEVKPIFESYDEQLDRHPSGIPVSINIQAANWSTSGIVTSVDRIIE